MAIFKANQSKLEIILGFLWQECSLDII